jgi:indoleamine 2,3-dioxygenase
MVSYSPRLVSYAVGALDAVEAKDRAKFDSQMAGLNETYESVNKEMEMMWSRSMPEDYIKFRTFIMGTKNQVIVQYLKVHTIILNYLFV